MSVVFATLADSAERIAACRWMVQSLRAFGGALTSAPVWLMHTDEAASAVSREGWMGLGVEPALVPRCREIGRIVLGEKVAAAAEAERRADAEGAEVLAWLDAEVLVASPPELIALAPDCDAALRPVHHLNVGLRTDEPIDAYWQTVYRHAGQRAAAAVLHSLVEDEPIRAYFNTHIFALRPSLGICREWLRLMTAPLADGRPVDADCPDGRHRVFLHQAVLSALLVERIPWERIRLLPAAYSYPYNLHAQIPPPRRAQSLSDLACVVCEGREMVADHMTDIRVEGPIADWLAAHPIVL